jgi:uncharacterized repeat protein (TIGR01451 family)
MGGLRRSDQISALVLILGICYEQPGTRMGSPVYPSHTLGPHKSTLSHWVSFPVTFGDTDVDSMKKTSTRIATLGVVIVLGAFAITLAQHDARKREREQPIAQIGANQPAIPIPLESGVSRWEKKPVETTLVVRGNNGPSQSHNAEQAEELASFEIENHSKVVGNPLRGEFPDSEYAPATQTDVIQASGEVPVDPPALPQLPSTQRQSTNPAPPSWLGGLGNAPTSNAPVATLPTFPMPSPTAAVGNSQAEPSSQRSSSAIPGGGAPLVPGTSAASTVVAPNIPALPSLVSAGPPPQTTIRSDVGSMSDTQRGAMLPTQLVPQQPLANGSPFNQLPTGNQLPTVQATTTPNSNPGNLPSISSEQQSAAMTSSQPSLLARNASATNGDRLPNLTTGALQGLVSNQPGSSYLEGSQNPIMLVQKRAPEEIQVGKKATFIITVRNAGNATAHDVTVVDSVPRGVRFAESAPVANPDSQGLLVWKLGEMAAGDERTITLQIVPEVQGEVGSVASVQFATQASVRTVATLPKLELLLESQPDLLIGSRQTLLVTVRNTGTGVARDVRLEADIPSQLRHESGETQLEAALGDMAPNDVKRIPLDMIAIQPGHAPCEVRAISEDGITAEGDVAIEVLSPQLLATIAGPRLRYLERQATYQIQVKNSGTAQATNLEFTARLPAGLKFNSTNNRGTYDPSRHTVTWLLVELPPQQTAPIELTVLPVELGPQVVAFSAIGDLGLSAEAKSEMLVDGLAELAFTIGQDNGTIEVGASSTYSVQVTNVGNKPDRDVQLAVQLPQGAELIDVDSQVEYRVEGNKLLFAPIGEMKNKDQLTYRFQVRYNQAGTQVVRTQLTSVNWPVAVIKEEGTLVYNDQN